MRDHEIGEKYFPASHGFSPEREYFVYLGVLPNIAKKTFGSVMGKSKEKKKIGIYNTKINLKKKKKMFANYFDFS